MNEVAEAYEHEGVKVEIHYDTEPFSPREDGNLGVMLCAHRDYNLGDEQVKDVSFEVECKDCEGTGEGYGPETEPVGPFPSRAPDCPTCEGMGEIELSPIEWAKRKRGARVVLPLGLLDHSGITMYVGGGEHWCDPGGWDSGTVGIIFDTPETLAEYGCEDFTDERIKESLIGEVKVYDQYLTGDVYGYIVGEDTPFEESVWGFFGEEDVKAEANSAAEGVAEALKREKEEAAHWAARGTMTI